MSDDAPSAEPTDAELVRRANRGEAAAFAALYERHRAWMIAVAFRAVRDRDLALDAMHDAVTYWLTKFPGFVLVGQVKSFLYPVVRHCAIEQARKRRHASPSDAAVDRADDERATSLASAATLDDGLARLPDGQREVLLLHFGDGLTLAEVAAALAIPLGTVKSRLGLALAALREVPRLRGEFIDE